VHPLQAYSVTLIMHQTDVPMHIQASLPLTPMSSVHFFGPELLHLCKKFSFDTVFLFNVTCGGNLLPFVGIHSMTITCNFL
jgi:hypothetical protein